jgi:RHS repeat-associated protein
VLRDLDHYNLYGNGMIGKLDDAGQKFFYIQDHLSSVRVVLNQNGCVDSWTDYYPFGRISHSTLSSNSPRESFAGYEYDSETDLYRAGVRSLNSALGRFTTTDPAGEFPSPYVYVGNNPLIAFDPTGMFTQFKVDGEVVYDDGVDNGLEVETTQETIDEYTDEETGETDWQEVINDDDSKANIVDADKNAKWQGELLSAVKTALGEDAEKSKIKVDYKGNITVTQAPSTGELLTYMLGPLAIGRFGNWLANVNKNNWLRIGPGWDGTQRVF